MAESWAVAYRPNSYDEIVGNEKNGEILRNSVVRGVAPKAVFLAGNRGSGKCFDENQLVLTANGLIKGKFLKPLNSKEGQFVDFSYPLVNIQKEVENTSKYYDNGEKDTLVITTIKGYQVVVTPNHPLYVFDGYDFKWKTAGTISDSDFLTLPRNTKIFGSFEGQDIVWTYVKNKMDTTDRKESLASRKIPKRMTTQLAELMGLFVGDCGSSQSQGNNWKFESDIGVDPDMEEKIYKLYYDLFGVKANIYEDSPFKTKSKRSKLMVFPFSYKEGIEFLKYLGVKSTISAYKEVPWTILQSGEDIQKAFIRGLFEADGWCYVPKTSTPEVGYASASESLVRQLQVMLLNMDIISMVRPRWNEDYQKDYYYLSISDGFSLEKYKSIGFLSDRKMSNLLRYSFREETQPRVCISKDLRLFAKVYMESKLQIRSRNKEFTHTKRNIYGSASPHPNNFSGLSESRITKILDQDETLSEETRNLLQEIRDDFYLQKVKSITPGGLRQTIDFEMPISHSFILNGISSHNTSLARLYSKTLECDHLTEEGNPCGVCDTCRAIEEKKFPDVIEVDAASENSVQNIRELIKTLNYVPSYGKYKVLILDECLTDDTLVMREGGYPENISSIKDGQVLSWKNSLEGKTVNSPISRKSEILKVNSFFDYIKGSPNHRMLVYSKGKLEYKMLRDIEVGESLVMPKNLSMPELEFSTNFTTALAELFGITAADAVLTEYCVQFDVKKPYKIKYLDERLLSLARVIDPDVKYKFTITKRGTHLYRIYSKIIVEEMVSLGCSLGSKEDHLYLSKKVFKFGFSERMYLFWGYTYFDGSQIAPCKTRKSYGVEVSGAGTNFIRGLKLLLHQMGVVAPFKTRERATFDLSYLRFIGPSLQDLKDLTISTLPKDYLDLLQVKYDVIFKTPVKEHSYKYRASINPQDSDYPQLILSKVASIQHLQEEIVYDFEVDENHNFLANGFISHNCHSLSSAATNALLKTLEEPPEYVYFIFCTTEPLKVLETIRSRCLMFNFRNITVRDITKRLSFIANKEGVNIDDLALEFIAKHSNGGMRDAIMLLQQASLTKDKGEFIKTGDIMELVGFVSIMDIQRLFIILKSGSVDDLLEWLDTKYFSPVDIMTSSINFLETIIFVKQGVSPSTFVPKDQISGIVSLSSAISFSDVMLLFREFTKIIYDLKNLALVNTQTLFRLQMLQVYEKLNTAVQTNQQAAMVITEKQQSFIQKLKAEFDLKRIPIPV